MVFGNKISYYIESLIQLIICCYPWMVMVKAQQTDIVIWLNKRYTLHIIGNTLIAYTRAQH